MIETSISWWQGGDQPPRDKACPLEMEVGTAGWFEMSVRFQKAVVFIVDSEDFKYYRVTPLARDNVSTFGYIYKDIYILEEKN